MLFYALEYLIKNYVSPPDYDARKHLFEFCIADRSCKNIDYEILAGQTVNYTCSNIEYMVDETSRIIIFNEINTLTMDTLLKTIEQNPSSIYEYFKMQNN